MGKSEIKLVYLNVAVWKDFGGPCCQKWRVVFPSAVFHAELQYAPNDRPISCSEMLVTTTVDIGLYGVISGCGPICAFFRISIVT
jgi:hypothetical protein